MSEFQNTTREIELLIPELDQSDPDISVVVPALNESVNIREFVSWAIEGINAVGVSGEVLIVDSSVDDTATLARDAGARVLRVPRRGLGRAYIDALPYIRGKLVIMGDADCTYDFRILSPFFQKHEEGYDFIMGSRFRGTIERGSMPIHHRYLGTPLTTWILNRIFSTRFSDIHCGMRAISTTGLRRLNLQCQSWEYASEMVIKASRLSMAIAEVPVSFYRDRNGRVSHHRRSGWFSPFSAAWQNLRAMFVFGADLIVKWPSRLLTLWGTMLCFSLSFGPISFAAVTFSVFWQLFGALTLLVGVNLSMLGRALQPLVDPLFETPSESEGRKSYNQLMILAFATGCMGVLAMSPLVWLYLSKGLRLSNVPDWPQHLAISGFICICLAFMTFAHAVSKEVAISIVSRLKASVAS